MKRLLLILLFAAPLSAQYQSAWQAGGSGSSTLDSTSAVIAVGETGDTPQTGTIFLTEGSNITITRSGKTFTLAAAGAAAASKTDSLSAAHGDEDVDKLFPNNFNKFTVDSIAVKDSTSLLFVSNSTFAGTVEVTGALTQGGSTVIDEAASPDIQGLWLFDSGRLQVSNAGETFQAIFRTSSITADRNLWIPLLTGNDSLA